VIPIDSFPFGWNFNSRSSPSSSSFTSTKGSSMGGPVMPSPTNTPFASNIGDVLGNYFLNTNQGTPFHKEFCAFPSFGNVGVALMAILIFLDFPWVYRFG
jgi:hypothetical protein